MAMSAVIQVLNMLYCVLIKHQRECSEFIPRPWLQQTLEDTNYETIFLDKKQNIAEVVTEMIHFDVVLPKLFIVNINKVLQGYNLV